MTDESKIPENIDDAVTDQDEKLAAAKAAASKIGGPRKRTPKQLAAERATQKMKEAVDKAKAAQEAAAEARKPKKGIVQVRSLFIRADHSPKSQSVGGLVFGNEVEVFETFVDGDDTWARIGENQWAAMIYNGETYIKIEE